MVPQITAIEVHAISQLDLRPVLQGWTLQAVSVGPEHDPIVLACELPPQDGPAIDEPENLTTALCEWNRQKLVDMEHETPKLNTLNAKPVMNLIDEAQGWHIVNVSVGPNDDPIMLVSEAPDIPGVPYDMQPPTPCRILHFTAEGRRVVDLPPHEMTAKFRYVQPLGDHCWLVVHLVKHHGRHEGAYVYAADGQLLRSFAPGDAVSQVQTTRSGQIWVGYGDEGVFSNSDQLGPAGLACMDHRGIPRLLFHEVVNQTFPALDRAGRRSLYVSSCYALNVEAENSVWFYYYDAFPLVRVHNGEIDRIYKGIPVRGSQAFAVQGGVALFAGAYKDSTTLFHVSLDSMAVENRVVVDDTGTPIAFDKSRSIGRGSRLYLVTEEMLYVVDLADL